jgi:hypothetical protein
MCFDYVLAKIYKQLGKVFKACSKLNENSLKTFNYDFSTEKFTIDYVSIVGGLADSNYVCNQVTDKINELKSKY